MGLAVGWTMRFASGFRRPSAATILGALAWHSLALAACGARTPMPAGNGAGGSAGDATSATVAGGGAVATCVSNGDCPEGTYCDYAGDDCGLAGVAGTCETGDVSCDDDCPGVCGCDGAFYCNACLAGASGVDVDAEGLCHMSNVTYSARLWLGGLDHLLLFKADWDRDTCLQVHLSTPTTSTPGFDVATPASWGVQGAMTTHRASDCATDFIEGESFGATGGEGTVSWELPAGLVFPCEVSLDLALRYADPEPWILPVETMQASAVPVEDGCF
jgi:hypothetical protein